MRVFFQKFVMFLLLLLFSINIDANSNQYLGHWQTIDDDTGKPRSVVNIYLQEGKLFGDIIEVFPQPGEALDPLCEKCKGKLHNKKIIGLQIISNMEFKKGKWNNGIILDPDNGKFYDCKIWLEKNKLMVRGYIGFFYRTQQWIKLKTA